MCAAYQGHADIVETLIHNWEADINMKTVSAASSSAARVAFSGGASDKTKKPPTPPPSGRAAIHFATKNRWCFVY
jgi:hypothetical protein